MTTQELHIELDVLLQKVNSNWNKDFIPQEYDLVLNREISKFIKQRTNTLSNNKQQSVYDIVQRVQNLNSLVETVQLNSVALNQKESQFELPFDFLGYISSEVGVYPICTGEVIPMTTTNNLVRVRTFNPIPATQNINTLTGLVITLTYTNVFDISTTVTLFDLATLPASYIPQDNIEDYKKIFIINNAITNLIRKKLLTLDAKDKIEFKYNNYTNKFEFRCKSIFTTTYTINGVNQTTTNVDTYNPKYMVESTLKSPLEIVDEEFKSHIRNSYLSTSKDEVIKGFLRENKVIYFNPPSVVSTEVSLTYIRKPLAVDLLLGIDSELPNEVLIEIVANAVQTLKGIVSSDDYEKYVRENTLIE
jgi:hypothetical protein